MSPSTPDYFSIHACLLYWFLVKHGILDECFCILNLKFCKHHDCQSYPYEKHSMVLITFFKHQYLKSLKYFSLTMVITKIKKKNLCVHWSLMVRKDWKSPPVRNLSFSSFLKSSLFPFFATFYLWEKVYGSNEQHVKEKKATRLTVFWASFSSMGFQVVKI